MLFPRFHIGATLNPPHRIASFTMGNADCSANNCFDSLEARHRLGRSPSMKKCTYCGRENKDHETHCWECGTQEFDGEVAPFSPEQKSRSTLRQVLFRLAVSSCVFMAVSGLSLYVA